MWTAIAAIAGAAALLAVLVRRFEPSFAFFPTPGEDVTPRALGVAYESSTIDTSDGERLHAWTLRPATTRATVVYFHGNGGNLSIWAPILADIARHGFAVLAFDYRGYGSSTGRPSERGLYRDVDAVLQRVWRDRPREPVVYWGRSLGTTMAAYAAAARPPAGVILEAGFPDARSLLRSSPPLALLAIFSSYRFPTASYMQRVSAPALVLHGDADSVVPYALGRKLFDAIKGTKDFATIRGGDHNDATPADPATYWNAVLNFVSRLPRADAARR